MTRASGKAIGIESANGPETHDKQQRDFASDERGGKAFVTLREQFASSGFTLIRAFADDGSVRFFVGRWGLCRELANIEAAHAFAEQAGVCDG